jgi:hypothetical protein
MLALYILAGLAYLQIGYRLGRRSWDVWDGYDSDRRSEMLYFPVSSLRGWKWRKRYRPLAIDLDLSPQGYSYLMSLAWPLKVGWNLPILAVAGCWYAAIEGPKKLFAAAGRSPRLKARKGLALKVGLKAKLKAKKMLSQKRREKRALPPKEAEPTAALVDEHRINQERIVLLQTRNAEIEALPDFEKVRFLRARL